MVWWNGKTYGSKYHMSPKKKLYYQHGNMKACPFFEGFSKEKEILLLTERIHIL